MISAFWRLRQEDQESRTDLGYIARLCIKKTAVGGRSRGSHSIQPCVCGTPTVSITGVTQEAFSVRMGTLFPGSHICPSEHLLNRTV